MFGQIRPRPACRCSVQAGGRDGQRSQLDARGVDLDNALARDLGTAGVRHLRQHNRLGCRFSGKQEHRQRRQNGRAWACDVEGLRQSRGVSQDLDATIGSWIVEARWAHPLWHSYAIFLIHLRPLAGGAPAKIHVDGATHEFILFALDPDGPRTPAILGEEYARILRPANFAAQLVEADDDGARWTIEGIIDQIIMGQLNPDTDALRQWVALFGDAMLIKGSGTANG